METMLLTVVYIGQSQQYVLPDHRNNRHYHVKMNKMKIFEHLAPRDTTVLDQSIFLVSKWVAVAELDTPAVLIQIPTFATPVMIAAFANIRVVAIPATIVNVNGVK